MRETRDTEEVEEWALSWSPFAATGSSMKKQGVWFLGHLDGGLGPPAAALKTRRKGRKSDSSNTTRKPPMGARQLDPLWKMISLSLSVWRTWEKTVRGLTN